MDGQRLLKLRTWLGFTQQQMADKLGVYRHTVARWERNERAISEPMKRLIEMVVERETIERTKTVAS